MNKSFLRNCFLSALSGILLVVSFPSFNLSYLAWLGFIPLLMAIKGKGYKESFFLGFVTGCIFYAGTVYWLVGTLRVYGEFSWLASVAIGSLLVCYLALYFGLFALGSSFFNRYFYSSVILALPALWVTLEYVRTYLLSGFPWNLLGYSQWNNLVVAQMAAFTGVYGVSFFILVVNVFAVKILHFALGLSNRRPSRRSIELFIAMVICWLGYGWVAISGDTGAKKERAIKAAVIQPNISPDMKWEPKEQKNVMDTYAFFVDRVKNNALSLVVFPESAVPGLVAYDLFLKEKTAELATMSRAYLLIGSIDRTGENYFTSCFFVSPDGHIAGKYDKTHLVPLGEIFPFRPLLEKFFPVVKQLGDFTPGSNLEPVSTPHGKIGVTICYEDIFPNLVRTMVKNGAEVIVNVTIDSWYLETSAPYQHYAFNVFRAIENRRWVIRSAATGISGFIDPYGYSINETRIFQPAISICKITPETKLSFYSKYGDIFAKACGVIIALWGAAGLIRRTVSRRS